MAVMLMITGPKDHSADVDHDAGVEDQRGSEEGKKLGKSWVVEMEDSEGIDVIASRSLTDLVHSQVFFISEKGYVKYP